MANETRTLLGSVPASGNDILTGMLPAEKSFTTLNDLTEAGM